MANWGIISDDENDQPVYEQDTLTTSTWNFIGHNKES